MSKAVWVGVDVGKESFFAAVASGEDAVADWARLPVKEFAFCEDGLERFVRWVSSAAASGDTLSGVCIESTGRLGWRFTEQLEGALGPVSMENPARTRAFGDSMGLRDKTDRVDACVLALYGVAMQPKATTLQSISDAFGIYVSGPFEVVTGSSGMFMPTRIPGISLQEGYLAFDEQSIVSRSVTEPYSGSHDLDADGFTNAEEYEIVVVVGGGSLADFARAASGLPPLTTDTGGGGGGGGGCFIATATYGTPLAQEISVLRGVRDAYLLDTALGAAFVDTYYRMSPPIADLVARSPFLATVVRAVLIPIVVASTVALNAPGLSLSALACMLITALYTQRRRHKSRVARKIF